MLNNVSIMGRFTKDVEVRNTPDGTPVCDFTLAVDRDYKGKDAENRETDFLDCVCFGERANFIGRNFGKGDLAGVVGRLRTRNYTRADGVSVHKTEIAVDNIYFGGRKPAAEVPAE